MKYLVIAGLAAALALIAWIGMRYFGSSQRPEGAKSRQSIYDYTYRSIDGREVSLGEYRGRTLMIVNVASECGYTPQYESLERLYRERRDRMVILGFPSNDFGGQEPGSNEDIASFCRLNYGVSFPLAQKTGVTGDDAHPVFRWLTDRSLNGWNESRPRWNFHKYIVGADGELLAVFPSATHPESSGILAHLD